MRLVIIGATGSMGKHVTQQRLLRGHSVTAVARNSSLEEKERLHVVFADPCKVEELTSVISEQDAAISCLGQRPGGNPWLVRDAAAATLQTMRQNGLNAS